MVDNKHWALGKKQEAKGQVATEFFLYAGVFLIVVIATYTIVSSMQANEIQYREAFFAREIGQTFSDAVNLAVRSGPGFRYNITLAKTFLGKSYDILFDDQHGRIFFDWTGTYGQSSNFYFIATYDYKYSGCIKSKKLISDAGGCQNILSMYNNGSTLFVEQPPGGS